MDRVRNKLRKMEASVERDEDNITISTYSSGYNVKMSLGDNGTRVFFKIDDSFSKPKGMEKEDARQVAGTVKEMFEAITSSLNKGSVLVASPYKKDGKGESRRRAFRMAGFKSASPTGDMYARVEGDGKIVGIDWRQAVSRLEMGNF